MNIFLPKMVLTLSLLMPSLLSCVNNQSELDINRELNKYKKELEKIRKHIGFEDRYRQKIKKKNLTCDELYKKVIDKMHNRENLSSKEKMRVLLSQGNQCRIEEPSSIFKYRNAPNFPEFLESLSDVAKNQTYGGLARKICNETLLDNKFYWLGLKEGEEYEIDSKYNFILSCLPCLERHVIKKVCAKERDRFCDWEHNRIMVLNSLSDGPPLHENAWKKRRQFVKFLEENEKPKSYFYFLDTPTQKITALAGFGVVSYLAFKGHKTYKLSNLQKIVWGSIKKNK